MLRPNVKAFAAGLFLLKEVEKMADITLTLLTGNDREQFILDNQRAFKYGAMEEFGERDSHFEENGEIISRKTIENSIDHGVAYRIREDGKIVGGLVLQINEKTHRNHLDLLFVSPDAHSKGIGTLTVSNKVTIPGIKIGRQGHCTSRLDLFVKELNILIFPDHLSNFDHALQTLNIEIIIYKGSRQHHRSRCAPVA